MADQNKAISPEFIYDVLGEIANRIERCGASVELTNAVSITCDLRQAIGNKYNPSNDYALERVIKALSKN